MTQRWNVQQSSLEIHKMPFYWRLSSYSNEVPEIPSHLGIRVSCNEAYDYLQYLPTASEWQALNLAYLQNCNIGFLNPESGQIHKYGSSVNRFFLDVINEFSPKKIYEIGCGAGFSIDFLKESGWKVTGIDPSEYSLKWSKRLNFDLINVFFDCNLISGEADLIYCNDVFEHIPEIENFSLNIYKSLKPGGVFCFSTTNSTQSIALGDISMLEHQHVNMFTERSLYLILSEAGFSNIRVNGGAYGNTFHVVATKGIGRKHLIEMPHQFCHGFFERAHVRIEAFENFYNSVSGRCQFYVPLRCIPYLAAVGDFGKSEIFDSNTSWQGKKIDGYDKPIKSISDICKIKGGIFFIGSLTFYDEIKRTLLVKGFREEDIFSISSI